MAVRGRARVGDISNRTMLPTGKRGDVAACRECVGCNCPGRQHPALLRDLDGPELDGGGRERRQNPSLNLWCCYIRLWAGVRFHGHD